jgi:hypothetical protein
VAEWMLGGVGGGGTHTFCMNAIVQPSTVHGNGFSPVCVRVWRVRCSSFLNAVEQVAHTCGLSVLCVWDGPVGGCGDVGKRGGGV